MKVAHIRTADGQDIFTNEIGSKQFEDVEFELIKIVDMTESEYRRQSGRVEFVPIIQNQTTAS